MAASERLSSAREPRSVTREAATSEMISSTVDADERVAPVQVMSPMVRKRTRRLTGDSVGQVQVGRVSEQHAVALDAVALVRKVERGQRDLFEIEILPDVHLGPVADRKDAEVLAQRFCGR